MAVIKTPEREISDMAAKIAKLTQERDDWSTAAEGMREELRALRSLDLTDINYYTDEQLEERRRAIVDLQARRWDERCNRMRNAFKVLGVSRFESFEELVITSLDLQNFFSPPNLAPPAALQPLVESIRAAAPRIPGDHITITIPMLAALRRACSPLGDRAELYWGRHRLTTAPTPDPSIVY